MRAESRLGVVAALITIAAAAANAQNAVDGPVLGARRLAPNAPLKVWLPEGDLRIVSWDRDSIVVRGRIVKPANFFFGGDSAGMKFGVEQREGRSAGRGTLVAYIPRRSKVSVKTVSANITGAGTSGWFYSVSGAIRLSGAATSIEVESMSGNLDLNVSTPWLRARTGDGHLLLRGTPQDVDAATIGGTLDIAATGMMRGEFGSVSGDIHYVGSPAPGGIFEFTNHSGAVDLVLPQSVSGVFALSSIEGSISNGFEGITPVGARPKTMRVALGRGGAQVTVRTFKGAIRILPQ
jgi:hypothetical protein